MDRKGKLLLVIILVIIAFLLGLSFFLTNKVLSYQNTLDKIAVQMEHLPEIKDGANGTDGQNGHDGHNGVNGADAVSTDTTTTIIQDVPLVGQPGAPGSPGATAPLQETRLNPTTGDLETKYSDDDTWKILVPCSKLLVGCPDISVTIGTPTGSDPSDIPAGQ